jgi:CubicO group peptidase (beta-lactamase class C family)
MRNAATLLSLMTALVLWGPAAGEAQSPLTDPGTGPWALVSEDDMAEVCRLDPELLQQVTMRQDMSFAVVRYGRLCFVSGEHASDGPGVSHVFSATKTLGALLTGAIMYQTRDLQPSSTPMRGPLREFDRMDHWLDLTTLPARAQINPDATVAHVLAMVGYSEDLSYGQKTHQYDGSGRREINQLIRVIDNVVKQDPRRFGSDAVEAKARLFAKLGLEHSRWNVGSFGVSWNTSLLDMARVGLAILHGGVYNGERLADSRYIYNMTHPAFEDGSTGYGYLTWLSNTTCTPNAIHASYPHGISESSDCADGECEQEHDVGVWSAIGARGQYIVGHRGLDLLVVGKNWNEGGGSALWGAVLPSVVAADPKFKGNQDAFCEAYSKGEYAPDLVKWEGGL